MSDRLLEVHNLKKTFQVKASAFSVTKLQLKAVDGVSFDLNKGKTLGLVGESGCGKTTVGRCLLRIYETDGGRVFLNPEDSVVRPVLELDAQRDEVKAEIERLKAELAGRGWKSRDLRQKINDLTKESLDIKARADRAAAQNDILTMDARHLKQRRKQMQMVFQDPWSSLNPRMIVKDLIAEGPREFRTHTPRDIDSLVHHLLDKVGLPRLAATRYPHEFSGGQRQRIGIARALALSPDLIVCDEPVSALDVSIQAQVLNLLITLQEDFGLAYIFIAHDLSVVQYISDRVAVMYLGRIVEIAESHGIYEHPRHPYTVSLLSSVPVADPDASRDEILLKGDVPSPVNPPSGCTFHPRCRYATDVCRKIKPELLEDASGHAVACHNPLTSVGAPRTQH